MLSRDCSSMKFCQTKPLCHEMVVNKAKSTLREKVCGDIEVASILCPKGKCSVREAMSRYMCYRSLEKGRLDGVEGSRRRWTVVGVIVPKVDFKFTPRRESQKSRCSCHSDTESGGVTRSKLWMKVRMGLALPQSRLARKVNR